MPANSFTPWQNIPPYDAPVASQFGPSVEFRDRMDARRMGQGANPDANYPDGYLGTVINRRDRLDVAVDRINRQPVQRGVHKGDQVDRGDYMWPKMFNPATGLLLQANGKKFAPIGTTNEQLIAEGKYPVPAGVAPQVDPVRAEQLASMRPRWR